MEELVYFDTGEEYFGSGCSIFINRYCEPSHPHLHAHNFFEIAYVFSGSGIHRIGNKEYNVGKGDLFLINYDTPHEFRSLPDLCETHPLTVLNCVFKPDFMDDSLKGCISFSEEARYMTIRSLFAAELEEKDDLQVLGQENAEIERLYEKMLWEFQCRQDGYLELLKAYLTELLIMIFRAVRKKRQESQSGLISSRTRVVEKVMEYLKSHYSGSVKLQDLSMVVFLSPNYICRIFREATGLTLSEYIQNIRIEEACRLLGETDRKVVDIAQEVGYRDFGHFSEVFRKITGKSPSTYRSNRR